MTNTIRTLKQPDKHTCDLFVNGWALAFAPARHTSCRSHKVLRVLEEVYRTREVPDFIRVCQCLYFLDDAQGIASVLDNLIKKAVVRPCSDKQSTKRLSLRTERAGRTDRPLAVCVC